MKISRKQYPYYLTGQFSTSNQLDAVKIVAPEQALTIVEKWIKGIDKNKRNRESTHRPKAQTLISL